MKIDYNKTNMLRGLLIYTSGDTVAAIILGEFLWTRIAGMMLIAATVYALEIPNYFNWINRHVEGNLIALKRTVLALLYFNPLWIARHLFFIKFFSSGWQDIGWGIIRIGFYSFIANIPLSLFANYIIQNKISLRWRFLTSAIFSALMAIYYALSSVLFD